jgi:hypothetical protein
MSLKDSGVLPDEDDEKQFSKDPESLPLWKKILLKNNKPILEKNNEDN